MAEIEINLSSNDNSGDRGSRPPVDNSPGVSAQDQNFSPLTGKGAPLHNRKGLPVGEGGPFEQAYRPESFEAAPELLNLLSIMSTSFQSIREIFLPLRKVYQLYANNVKQESKLLGKKEKEFDVDEALGQVDDESLQKEKTKEEDVKLILEPFLQGLFQPISKLSEQQKEALEKEGFKERKAGQMLPWREGKPQGRVPEGGVWEDTIGKYTEELKNFTPVKQEERKEGGLLKTVMVGSLASKVLGFMFKPVKLLVAGIGKLLTEGMGKLFGPIGATIAKNFLPLAKFAGLLTAGAIAFKALESVILGFAEEWKQFSFGRIIAETAHAMEMLQHQMEAANLTDDEMTEFTQVNSEIAKELIIMKSILVDAFMPSITAIQRLVHATVIVLNWIVIALAFIVKLIGMILNWLAYIIEFVFEQLSFIGDWLYSLYALVDSWLGADPKLEPFTDDKKNTQLLNSMFTVFGSKMNTNNVGNPFWPNKNNWFDAATRNAARTGMP